MEKNVARIFEDANGYHVCNDRFNYLNACGTAYKTKAEAIRSAKESGYTHAIGSGTYWNGIRKI